MDIQDSSAAIYSEAKSEYTKQLVYNFQPALLRFFLNRFSEGKQSPLVTSRSKSALSEFQDSLSQIPEWNLDKVRSETMTLLQTIQCDYTEELITAVFVAHTKILSAIRLHSKPRRKINITVPKPDHFMHRAMSECSRLLWSNIYLFSDSVSSLERQKNMNEVNRFLEEGILQAVRNLLPVKSILRDSLQEDDGDEVTGAPDTGVPETGVPETGVPEEGVPEEGVPEESVPEGGVREEGAHEEGAPEGADARDGAATPVITRLDENGVPTNIGRPEHMGPPLPSVVPSVGPSVVPMGSPVPVTPKQETLVIDTERSVGFTGIDSIFGTSGEAELRASIEESDDLKIIGDLEELDMGEIEEINAPVALTPLSADDYESL